MKKIIWAAFALVTLVALGCKKEPGFGGLASISGKVYAIDSTSGGNLKDEGYIGDYDVFIGIDGEPGLLDNIKTSYDGSYQFAELRKGTYNVWVYRRCDACAGDILLIKKTVVIKSNKEEKVLDDFKVVI